MSGIWRAASARSGSAGATASALVAENRPEWVVADLAIMSAGAITVPAYVTNTVEDHRHVFANSGARAVIVSKPALVRPRAGGGEPGPRPCIR